MSSLSLSRRLLPRLSRSLSRSLSTRASPTPPSDAPNHRSILSLDSYTIRPYIQTNAFVAPSASVIGSVTINDYSCILYNAVIRGDLSLIQIGAHTTIGENSTLSAGNVSNDKMTPAEGVASGLAVQPELLVGDYVWVGSNVRLHGCVIRGENIIGDCVTVEDGAYVGRGSVVLPGSVVGEGVEIADNMIWGGDKVVGEVTAEERALIKREAEERWGVTRQHMHEFLPGGFAYLEKEKLVRDAALQS